MVARCVSAYGVSFKHIRGKKGKIVFFSLFTVFSGIATDSCLAFSGKKTTVKIEMFFFFRFLRYRYGLFVSHFPENWQEKIPFLSYCYGFLFGFLRKKMVKNKHVLSSTVF